MPEWGVVVVEDDRTVASVHCRFLARMPGFRPLAVASTAAQAEELVANLRPDLLLLDLGLPGGRDGLDLMRRLRACGYPVEVIAVTAASSTEAVRATMQLGVVDYLVKPFDQERLRKSLGLFQRRMRLLAHRSLAQADVDAVCSDGPNAQRWLPRDLSDARLDDVRAALCKAPGALSADDVAAETGIARVTARRYLEYLVATGQASVEPVPGGPGRPRKDYRRLDGDAAGAAAVRAPGDPAAR